MYFWLSTCTISYCRSWLSLTEYMHMQFALVQQSQLHLSTLKLTLYCLGLLCSLNPKPSQCTLLIIKLCTIWSSPIPAWIINYQCKHSVLFRATSKIVVLRQFWQDMHWGKRGEKRGLGDAHVTNRKLGHARECEQKSSCVKRCPNAASPITAQLHIQLRTCRPEEHAALKLVLSIYQWSELFLLFHLQSTLPVHLSYFFITSFSLYSHLDFQIFLKARGCIYFFVFFIFHLSPASNPNVSLLNTQHAHLKNCVLELSLGSLIKAGV